jgi:hypothetical protein
MIPYGYKCGPLEAAFNVKEYDNDSNAESSHDHLDDKSELDTAGSYDKIEHKFMKPIENITF